MMIKKRKKRQNVLIMCLADPSGNPRPRRAAELCVAEGFNVSVVGYPPRQSLSVKSFFSIQSPSLSIFHRILRKVYAAIRSCLPFEMCRVYFEEKLYGLSKVKKLLNAAKFDLVIVEDLYLLPLGFAIKSTAKIIFDAREYYPRQNEGEIFFNLFEKKRREQLCQDYMPRCDAVVTVSEGLRQEYLRVFGVSAVLYRSTPPYFNLPVRPVNPNQIRMVYHGAANRNRRLENLIDVVAQLDARFSLDLILVGNERYQRQLRRRAALVKNIGFPKPVSITAIIATIARYDIGLCYFEPTTFNLRNCLPNKFFEYIQARLMVATGPSFDMADLVKKYGCGVVVDSFSVNDMANTLNSLATADVDMFKMRSDIAARDLCFEKESKIMVDLMGGVLMK